VVDALASGAAVAVGVVIEVVLGGRVAVGAAAGNRGGADELGVR
jgi:hypothetical protein